MKIENRNSDTVVLAELGRRIRRTRLDRNIPRDHLAAEAGVSLASIVRLEKGTSTNLRVFLRVLRALGLLEDLDRLVPEPLPSPIALLRAKGHQRERASHRYAAPQSRSGRRPVSWPTGSVT
jgi:transcriptional regulator with XRE-family HTH domain